jgi:hypothetical protein
MKAVLTIAIALFAATAKADVILIPYESKETECSQQDINKGLLIGGGIGLVTGLTAGVGTVAGMTVMGTGATVGWAGAMSSPFLTGSTIPIAVGSSVFPTGLGAYTGYVVSCAGEEIATGVGSAVDTVGSAIADGAEAVAYGAVFTYYLGAELVAWVIE